jgi:hypothetical protein
MSLNGRFSQPVYAFISDTLSAPESSFDRPPNTTAYDAGDLVATSTTAGSVAPPSFSIDQPDGYVAIPRMVLRTDATSGWGNVTVTVTLWSDEPTYTNGDGGAYVPATGAAAFLGQYSGTFVQFGDGAVAVLTPLQGSAPVAHANGQAVYWDVQINSVATPTSGQTFTLIPDIWN